MHARYVCGKTPEGAMKFLIQLVSAAQGFMLLDDDQSWHNGHGCGLASWQVVPARKVPKAERERLGTLKAARSIILPI